MALALMKSYPTTTPFTSAMTFSTISCKQKSIRALSTVQVLGALMEEEIIQDDYTGVDDGSGGRVAGDGVGDTNLPWQRVDYYPLINPVNLQVLWNNTAFPVSIFSNVTVSAFNFDEANRAIDFDLEYLANATGYINVSAPTTLLGYPWSVLANGNNATSLAVISQNETCTSIYLNTFQTIHSIQIVGANVVPEYPTEMIVPILMVMLSLLLVINTKKRGPSEHQFPQFLFLTIK